MDEDADLGPGAEAWLDMDDDVLRRRLGAGEGAGLGGGTFCVCGAAEDFGHDAAPGPDGRGGGWV